MNKRASRIYEFGPFRLNATERLLQRDTEVVPLTPKVLDTLLLLVENAGHVVDKNELMQQLWPDSFVEESSLAQNISLLRRALARDNGDANYIETVPKRGYRFVAEVRETDDISHEISLHADNLRSFNSDSYSQFAPPAVKSDRAHSGWLRGLAALLMVAAVLGALFIYHRYQRRSTEAIPRTIAVLPFKTIGADDEHDLLGLGMADALIMKLSKYQRMTVLPTSSVFRYTTRDKDDIAIGRELGVEGVLDGTLQRDGNSIRVTALLIRINDGKTVWTGKFDERSSSMFSIQDSLSEQLIASLVPEVDEGKIATAQVSKDTQAYQDYLTGLYFWNRRTSENLPKAISYLEHSVARDPNFALAHAILADCYYLSPGEEYQLAPPLEALARAEHSANKALELDPQLAEAHTVKAGIFLDRRLYDEANGEFRRAIELKPTYAVAHLRYGYFLYWSLKLDEALRAMRRAQELDPVSPVTNSALASMLLNARDYDNSIKYSKRALELEPGSMGARLNLADAYVQKRMFTEAFHELDQISNTHMYALQEKTYALAAAGRSTEALQLLSRPELDEHAAGPFFHARIYGALGDRDKAFKFLEKIYVNRFNVAALKYDAELDALRSDERFNDFLKRHQIKY